MSDFERFRDRLHHAPDAEVGGGATEEEISRAEGELAVRFPETYRQFLREFGWVALGPLEVFGLGHRMPPFLDVVRNTQSEREEAVPPLAHRLIPIANDGGGNLFCLDIGGRDNGAPVVFWSHERAASQNCDVIADGFDSWILQRLEELSEL